MFSTKNHNEKMIKIIKCYPSDNIESVLLSVSNSMSRPDSREYNSCKTVDKKLEFVLKREIHRAKFFVGLYSKIFGDAPSCGYESVSEIFNKCNGENCLERIAYFLLCCGNDVKYYEKNISSFLSSNVADKTLSNSWEEIEPIPQENTKDKNIELSDNISEVATMNTYYVGYIKKQNTFYNFYPIAKKDEHGLVGIEYSDLTELFPKHGSINLRTDSIYNNEAYDYLSDLDGVIDSFVDDSEIIPKLYAVKFSIDQLSENNDESNRFRLDIDSTIRAGVHVEEVVFSAEKLNIFRIAESDTENPNLVEGTIKIYNECYVGENVLLYSGHKFYGPFITQINRNTDMNVAPNIRTAQTPFVVNCWEDSDVEIIETTISIFRTEFYARIAFVTPDKKKQEDLITESDIIEAVAKIIVDSDNDSKKFLRVLSNESPLFSSVLPDNVILHRKNMALRLFSVEESRKEILKQFSAAVTQSDIAEVFKDRVVSRDKYNETQSELITLRKENKEQSVCIAEYKDKEKEQEQHNESSIDKQEHELLMQQYQELETKYIQLQDSIANVDNLNEEIRNLEQRKAIREEDAQKADAKAEKAESNATKAASAMHSKLDSVMLELREQVSAAFDPVISSALLEAAGRFDSDNEATELAQKISSINSLDGTDAIFDGNQDDLLNYLVTNIQRYRKYSFNDIVNILICCTQNFLTIFSGEPGIGKTSICNIIANSLGLNLFENHAAPNRYVLVSVEKGWATKRDLIGYYNPLTHKYDKSNSSVYNGLTLLDKEAEKSAYPFIILLDEANLSQMEFYWADFMNVADMHNELCKINIGTEKDLVVPKTLRFLATINNDETTVELSPRLIDRAWIIHLPNSPEIVADIPSSYNSIFNKIISWKSLCDAFESKSDQEIDDDTKDILDSIYKVFVKYRYTISPRIKASIEHYIAVAIGIMEDEQGIAKNKKAIDYAVLQKLLPKISGIYDSRIETMLGELMELTVRHNLQMTKKMIEDAVYKHQNEMDMGYCSFLN